MMRGENNLVQLCVWFMRWMMSEVMNKISVRAIGLCVLRFRDACVPFPSSAVGVVWLGVHMSAFEYDDATSK